MKIDKKFIARTRLRFTLGGGVIGSVMTIIGLLTFVKVWEKTFEYYGIPMIIVCALFPIVYIVSCWYIGMLYDTKGYWQEENSHANENLNPEFKQICKDVTEIKNEIHNHGILIGDKSR